MRNKKTMKIYKSTLKHLIKEIIDEIEEDICKTCGLPQSECTCIDEGGPGSGQKGHKTDRGGYVGQKSYTPSREQLRNVARAIKTGKYADGTQIDPKQITQLKRRLAVHKGKPTIGQK